MQKSMETVRVSASPDSGGVDGPRYFFGIVRNIATENEGMLISEALLDARLDARDRILKRLSDAHEIIALVNPEPLDLYRALVDKALAPSAASTGSSGSRPLPTSPMRSPSCSAPSSSVPLRGASTLRTLSLTGSARSSPASSLTEWSR